MLDLYSKEYNPKRPVICIDECSIELRDEKVLPIEAKPGKLKKEDCEYERKGTCSIFVIVEPLAGRRWAIVTGKRGKKEFAEILRRVTEEWYGGEEIEEIEIVLDNLNTHRESVLYEYLEAERARQNIRRIKINYTPIHGSWLNMAEIEIGALMTQSLKRRIKSVEMLKKELEECVAQRNKEGKTINWEFTVAKAREKLGKHYPEVPNEYVPPEFI